MCTYTSANVAANFRLAAGLATSQGHSSTEFVQKASLNKQKRKKYMNWDRRRHSHDLESRWSTSFKSGMSSERTCRQVYHVTEQILTSTAIVCTARDLTRVDVTSPRFVVHFLHHRTSYMKHGSNYFISVPIIRVSFYDSRQMFLLPSMKVTTALTWPWLLIPALYGHHR